jgi:DNA polymerase-3 subunit alpha
VQHALAEDHVVSVRGRIEDRDATLNIFGRELEVLDVSSAEHGGGPSVRLALPAHRLTEQRVGELKRILADHPGDSPVRLSVHGVRKTTVYALHAKVNAATVASDVKGTFGAEAWGGLA